MIKSHRSEFKTIEQLYGFIKRKVEMYKIKLRSKILESEINIEVANSGKDILTFLPNFQIKSLKNKYPRIRNLKFSDEDAKVCLLTLFWVPVTATKQKCQSHQ